MMILPLTDFGETSFQDNYQKNSNLLSTLIN